MGFWKSLSRHPKASLPCLNHQFFETQHRWYMWPISTNACPTPGILSHQNINMMLLKIIFQQSPSQPPKIIFPSPKHHDFKTDTDDHDIQLPPTHSLILVDCYGRRSWYRRVNWLHLAQIISSWQFVPWFLKRLTKYIYLKSLQSLLSGRKSDLSISKRNVTKYFHIQSWIIYFHIFQLHTWFYFFLLVRDSYPLTSKRRRCRNLL